MHYLEQELYRSVQNDASFFKFIQQATFGGVWYWDVEVPKNVWINDLFWKMLGYDLSDEVITSPDWETLVHEDDLPPFQQLINNCLINQEQQVNTFVRFIAKDQSIVWMRGIGSSFRFEKENTRRLLITFTDVSELKEAEIETRQQSQRYEQIIEGANIGTWEWNYQTGEIRFNERWANIIGYTLAEISPISFQTWEDFTHPDDLAKASVKLQEYIEGKSPFYESDVRMRHKEGDWIHVYTRGKVATYTKDGQAEWVSGYHQDISSRKQAEMTRQVYEGKKLKAIIESMNDLVIILDRNLVFLEYHQPSSIPLWAKPADFVGKHFEEIGFPEPAQSMLKRVLMQVFDTKMQKNVEYFLELPDGKKWYEAQVNPMLSVSGEVINAVCIIRDITNRKLAEVQVKESEQRFRGLFEGVESVAVQGLLADGTIIFWNKASEQLYGFTAEEAIGKRLTELIIPDDLKEQVERDVKEMCETGTPKASGELRLVDKYGATKEVFSNHIVLKRPDAPVEVFGIDVDLTERNQAEALLKKSEMKFRLFADLAPVGIVISNPEESPEYVSRKFTKITGYTLEDLPNIDYWWTQAYPDIEIQQKVRNVWKDAMAEARRSKKESPPLSHPIICKDGTKKYLEFRLSTAEDFNFIVATDVTYRELAQKEQQFLQAELEKSNSELAYSNAELEQFAYIASHDLQEPLRMVSSFVSLLEKKYTDALDEQGKKYIHFAVDGAARMREMIVNLLEYSRVGRFVNPDEEVNFNELIGEILQVFSPEMQAKQAKISVGEMPSMVIEKAPMQQVFQNLISNALKYTAKGVAPEIKIFVEEHPQFWKFAVKDNGIGIAPEYHEKVFAIFQRLHDRSTYQGNGLGLAITKKIIENKGGKIWLESTEGAGATFWFSIPKRK